MSQHNTYITNFQKILVRYLNRNKEKRTSKHQDSSQPTGRYMLIQDRTKAAIGV